MLILPWFDAALMPNKKNGRHWGATSKIKANYKMACKLIADRGEKPSLVGKIPLTILFAPPDRRPRDIDNMLAAIKPLIDGVAISWGIDDRMFRPMLLDDLDPVKNGAILLTWKQER